MSTIHFHSTGGSLYLAILLYPHPISTHLSFHGLRERCIRTTWSLCPAYRKAQGETLWNGHRSIGRSDPPEKKYDKRSSRLPTRHRFLLSTRHNYYIAIHQRPAALSVGFSATITSLIALRRDSTRKTRDGTGRPPPRAPVDPQRTNEALKDPRGSPPPESFGAEERVPSAMEPLVGVSYQPRTNPCRAREHAIPPHGDSSM